MTWHHGERRSVASYIAVWPLRITRNDLAPLLRCRRHWSAIRIFLPLNVPGRTFLLLLIIHVHLKN